MLNIIDSEPFEFEGKEYTFYEATQKQRQRQLYKDFNKADKLHPTSVRTYVYWYNRSKASKKVWANRKAQKKAKILYDLGSNKNNLELYLKDLPLRKYIKENKNFDKLKVGKQKNHLNDMENVKKKSQFKNIIEEIEAVFKENRGRGEFVRRDKSQLTELIEDSRLDGYNINREGDVVSTNRAIIHYSKNGYHIVPTLREFKELRRWKNIQD